PDRTVLGFIITEGRNRQIRRMCEAVELEVLRLKRTEIAGVKLGMLPQGSWRPLNEREMQRLGAVSTTGAIK
ncbi:MAG: pseudouridine synthase, partial [Clostridia bacterium]|nr:pseudouridine synthase [Clostridia bacterium]